MGYRPQELWGPESAGPDARAWASLSEARDYGLESLGHAWQASTLRLTEDTAFRPRSR